VSFDPADPYSREQVPDYGLYLDPQWRPPWPHDHVSWPDFGVPVDRGEAMDALKSLLARAREGQMVEVGCYGGHGRTGTALGCLAVLAGAAPSDAVAWVRSHYCPDAVETGEQEAFVAATRP
jgi:protein-tyrosine phosphatase